MYSIMQTHASLVMQIVLFASDQTSNECSLVKLVIVAAPKNNSITEMELAS